MPKLTAIRFFETPRMPSLVVNDIDCVSPNGNLKGWRAMLRGTSLFLVSPRGWKAGKAYDQYEKVGPCTIFEIPRNYCALAWSGDDTEISDISSGKLFTSEPFGIEAPAPLLAQLPAK